MRMVIFYAALWFFCWLVVVAVIVVYIVLRSDPRLFCRFMEYTLSCHCHSHVVSVNEFLMKLMPVEIKYSIPCQYFGGTYTNCVVVS